jgi:hypothetical protein
MGRQKAVVGEGQDRDRFESVTGSHGGWPLTEEDSIRVRRPEGA